MAKKRPPRRSGKRSTDKGRKNAKDHKVTARFSDEEFRRLAELSDRRGEKLSSLVRGLVLETIDEVAASIKEKPSR
ncbi:MAG: hypothetical protein R3325_09940 [Thermoanaerobaculia bacterium]|nr:hypothetical protein [Thermoanaerobaculia bacterium]